MRACPIPGCTRPAKDRQLMCWRHWVRVPRVLNKAIYATVGRDPDAYDKHVADAIAAVVAKEATVPTLTATCIITNCRKHAPSGEPFCSLHRD